MHLRSTAFSLTVLVAVTPLLMAAKPSTTATKVTTGPAASQPATTQEAKAQERAEIQGGYANLPVIGPYDVSQVIKVELKENRLVVTSPLESFDGDRLVKFHHPDDGATMSFHEMAAGSGNGNPDAPRFIQFYRYDFRDPQIVFFHSSVMAHPGYCQITGAWQLLEGMKDVSIIDQAERIDDTGAADPANVTLRVQGLDDDGNVTHKVEFKSADLRALMRDHPAEVNEYLRPVLRELDAESLLDLDPTQAWQVFGGEAHPDPKVVAKVKEILPELEAADFRDRETATGALKALGVKGALVLLQVDKSKLTPGQNQLIDELLAPYQQLDAAEVDRLRGDPAFLLTAMESTDAEMRRIAFGHLTKKLGHAVAYDPAAPSENRRVVVSKLRHSLLPPATTQSAPAH